MPEITGLIRNWWKQMLAVILLSLLTVGVITFLKPRLYLSVATAVPASAYAADKSKIFNENIQQLYASLGTPDDLDMILGTANLDTVYLAVTDQFNLFDHYKLSEKGNAARIKAGLLLRRMTKVMKSAYGELQVKVWDTDKNLAPQLANAIMDKLHMIHQDLQSAGNNGMLKGIRTGLEKLTLQVDSISSYLRKANVPGDEAEKLMATRKILQDQAQQYERLIGEYQLMVDSKPPVLITVEQAKPSIRPDKPKRMQIMIATAVLSLIFALFAALILERRKTAL
ncbi:MAG: hypothetical protein WBB06_11190 [Chitinophagaceae bacterium]